MKRKKKHFQNWSILKMQISMIFGKKMREVKSEEGVLSYHILFLKQIWPN